jgi:hypothetical protein
LEEVRRRCGDAARLYPGYFPETTCLLDPQTRYALLHIAVDLEKPIRAGLEYFYHKVSPGGAIIVHDYNNVSSLNQGGRKPLTVSFRTSLSAASRCLTATEAF